MQVASRSQRRAATISAVQRPCLSLPFLPPLGARCRRHRRASCTVDARLPAPTCKASPIGYGPRRQRPNKHMFLGDLETGSQPAVRRNLSHFKREKLASKSEI